MNKAFVRDEDQPAGRCPQCGSAGTDVGRDTLDAQMLPDRRGLVSETAYYCPAARCPVVYFDVFERTATVDDVRRPPYPKDSEAPICPCFDFSMEEIEADVEEGGVLRVRALYAKMKLPEAQCLLKAASGQCCLSEIQRAFFRLRSERSDRST